jgi:protein phosphatase 2C-like protein
MLSDAEVSTSLMIESHLETDTYVQAMFGQSIIVRLLSFRSQEADAQALPCQDYARITSNQQGTTICFCVCDGVGSSFKGDFSAHYLAERLVSWLQKLTSIPKKPAKLVRRLQPRLDQWARGAQACLINIEIPHELPPLVREVLEELRGTNGSETVFLCGRIDIAGELQLTTPSQKVKALFCWMGNVTARLFLSTNEHIDVGDKNNDSIRWSTLQGHKGLLNARILVLDALERLLIHTDGLNLLDEELAGLDDAQLLMRIEHLRSLPRNDDMTVLDLQWLVNALITEKDEAF